MLLFHFFVVVENDVFKKLLSEWLRTQFFLMDSGPQVFPSVAGEDEDDVKYALTEWRWKPLGTLWRSRWRSVGFEEGESCDFCACVNELWDITPWNMIISNTVSQSHYKDTLQHSSLQDPHIELDSAEFNGRDSIMESPAGSCYSHGSEKSTMCSVC